jgi:putative protease
VNIGIYSKPLVIGIREDANRRECAQPCRWNYALVEEKRSGEYYPNVEDKRGSYVFNSQDLCLIKHIPELIEAGVDSFKIEDRMKSIH